MFPGDLFGAAFRAEEFSVREVNPGMELFAAGGIGFGGRDESDKRAAHPSIVDFDGIIHEGLHFLLLLLVRT